MIAATIAASCGGSGNGGDGASAESSHAAPPVGTTESDELGDVRIDTAAADCSTVDEIDGGDFDPGPSLDVANPLALGSGLNPHNDQSPASFAYYGWVYEGLVREEPDGSIAPWLATCWETNAAGDQLTFHLHDGITFHDGSPFDADAVKANIDFVRTAGPPEVAPAVAAQLALVDSVEVIDEVTVRFDLAVPGEMLLLGGLIRSGGFMVAPGSLGSANTSPVGTGPYAVDGSNADLSQVDLLGYEGYWRPGLVGAESVKIVAVTDAQARIDGLVAGQFDTAVIDTNQVSQAPAYTEAPTVRIGFTVTDWTGQQVPALADRDVRCAMGQALNRAGIQEASGLPASTALTQFAVGPHDYAYIDDLDVADFDIDAAAAAFDATGEAGFTFTNGHLPQSFWPVVSSAWSGALAELGITMRNEALDPPVSAQISASLAEGRYPVQLVAFSEPTALMSLIARTGTASFNPSGVSPDGVVELVEAATGKSAADGEADVAAAWKIMLEECVFIMQQALPTAIGFQTNVSGVVHTTGVPISYWPHGVRVVG